MNNNSVSNKGRLLLRSILALLAITAVGLAFQSSGKPDVKVSKLEPVSKATDLDNETIDSGQAEIQLLGHADFENNSVSLVQYTNDNTPPPTRCLEGVDSRRVNPNREAKWRNARKIPWESFSYGEYIGPHRTPHVADYRLRVNDQLEFVYENARELQSESYRFQVGDEFKIQSLRAELNQDKHLILNDGTVSPTELGPVQVAGKTIAQVQALLNDLYKRAGTKEPGITVTPVKVNTKLSDLITAIQGNLNVSGNVRPATVSPDGTVQLPVIGRVPVIGLTIDEVDREINYRYRKQIVGLHVSPIILAPAPRRVFVLGEVAQEGQFVMTGPTTVLQSIALAGGELQGANLRHVVVFRRDKDWRLMATRLDLTGAVYGRRPQPSDEIWLRDSDLVIVPKMQIQRFGELVDLYITRSVYSIMPNQGFSLNFDNGSSL